MWSKIKQNSPLSQSNSNYTGFRPNINKNNSLLKSLIICLRLFEITASHMNTHFYQRLNTSGVWKTAQDNGRGYLLDGNANGYENKTMLMPSAEAMENGMMRCGRYSMTIFDRTIRYFDHKNSFKIFIRILK